MFIIAGSKNASIKEKQIDAPIQKLWFSGNMLLAGLITSDNPMASIISQLDMAKLSIQKQTSNGNIPLLLPIGLGSIAEICSNQEGHLNCMFTHQNGWLTFECTVDLSASNAIDSGDGKFLLLSLDMAGSAIDKIEVYGLDLPIVGNGFTRYNQLKVNANTQKSINVVGKDVIALPRTGFSQIDIVFPNRTVTYKKDIKAICQAIENVVANYVTRLNDYAGETPVSVYAQTYFDGVNYYTIGVQDAIEVRVLYTADTTVITTEETV